MLKAIETIYNGNKFRSRLEARWAVFFSNLNIDYLYELEGFDLNGDWYLPEFFIPSWNCWIEIKPDKPVLYDTENKINIEKREYRLCQLLAKESKKAVLLIGGDPWIDERNYDNSGKYKHDYQIAMFSSNYVVQRKNKKNEEEIEFNLPIYSDGNLKIDKCFYESDSYLYGHLVKNYNEHPEYFSAPVPKKYDTRNLIESDKEYYRRKFGQENHLWNYGIVQNGLLFQIEDGVLGLSIFSDYEKASTIIMTAFLKARQERF
jgi:hypothetical protein